MITRSLHWDENKIKNSRLSVSVLQAFFFSHEHSYGMGEIESKMSFLWSRSHMTSAKFIAY